MLLSAKAEKPVGRAETEADDRKSTGENPQILILDDSASALDFATDAALRKALSQDTENMTVFLVSQRASSVMHADKILVLDDGKMVGYGNHEELLGACGVYQEICRSQFSKEEGVQYA